MVTMNNCKLCLALHLIIHRNEREKILQNSVLLFFSFFALITSLQTVKGGFYKLRIVKENKQIKESLMNFSLPLILS